ncbi:MAG: hypothetical protein ACYCS1_05195 [Gammaproteobacteria bacterium]
MYTKKQLDFIREQLKAGNSKFSLDQYKCIFSKQGTDNILIQRIPNFMMGLAYKIDTDEFIYNYPHLDNIKEDLITTITDGIIQPKTNGTNIGIIKLKDGSLVHRTRGSINPDRFINSINVALLGGEKTILGVPEDIFTEFVKSYKKTFDEGKASKIIDDYGNIDLGQIVPKLKESLKDNFKDEIVGVFGELIMPVNPIAIDGNMKFGIYKELHDAEGNRIDYQYIIFDTLAESKEGDIVFLKHKIGINFPSGDKNILISDSRKLSELTYAMDTYPIEEGLVIKTDSAYWKFKRSDVLEWERLMGKLSNVLYFSAEHVFQQGLGYSAKEIFEEKVLMKPEIIGSITSQVWQEINADGVSRRDLIDYFATKNKSEGAIDSILKSAIYNNMFLLVAPELQNNGISKAKLYLEIPKYIFFDEEPLFYDENKQRFRANKWYNKMIGNVIGKVFQAEIQAEKNNHKQMKDMELLHIKHIQEEEQAKAQVLIDEGELREKAKSEDEEYFEGEEFGNIYRGEE